MPGDLNLKKSWNPALLKNQKKVWEREQEALKEYQAIKQKNKEIAQEREKEEMIRLQYGSDPALMPLKHKLELNKLGWMYDGPKNRPETDESGFREVEEDFLKNTKEMELLVHGAQAAKKESSRFDHVASVGAKKAAPAVLSDDPLLMIRRGMPRRGGSRSYGGGERSESGRSGRSGRSGSERSERSGRSGSERSERSGRSGSERRDRSGRSERSGSERSGSERSESGRSESGRERSGRTHGERLHRDRSPSGYTPRKDSRTRE